jgi:hypothetical protein
MGILKERKLSLSRKKARIGLVSQGFHFLGVNYLETQPQDNTRNACASDECSNNIQNGGGKASLSNTPIPQQTTPHPRTLRKARETVKSMVIHGFATQEIKNYLSRWCSWWAKTNAQWSYQQLLIEFIQTTHQS